MGWVQGFSIYLGIFLIVGFTAVNDYFKDKNLVSLASDVKRDRIGVIRGKKGVTQTISIYQLVVGDIVLIEPGCMVPADCLLVEGEGIFTNEEKYSDDRINQKKSTAYEENISAFPDPFLLSNTFVNGGSGRAVVCVVGKNSRRGMFDDKLDTNSKTKLQERLDNLGAICTKYGIYASLIILAASILNFIVNISFNSELRTFDKVIGYLSLYFTQFVAIIIVAVPEGLPMTISLSLAYSVMRMKKDGILLKDLQSPEKMGQVDQILVGKTGTLTKGDLKVTEFFVQSKIIKNKRANTLFNTELKQDVVQLIQDSIIFNCDARIEMDNKAYYQPIGNNTEVALLKFLQAADIPVHDFIKDKIGFVEYQIAFSTIRKNSAIAIKYPEHDLVRIFVKGAPEQLIYNCTSTYDFDGEVTHLNEEEQQRIATQVVSDDFCKRALRCMAFATKDYTIEEFNAQFENNNNFVNEENREETFYSNLRLIAIFAMED